MQENMKRGTRRNAVHTQQFYFRKCLVADDDNDETEKDSHNSKTRSQDKSRDHESMSHDHEYALMDVNTIVNGKVLYNSYQSSHIKAQF